MPEYRAIYKCRLCGEEFDDGRAGKDIAYMAAAVLTVKNHFSQKDVQSEYIGIMFTIAVMGRMDFPILSDSVKWRIDYATKRI